MFLADETELMQNPITLLSDYYGFIFSILFLTAFIIQLIYYLGIFSRFTAYKSKNKAKSTPPVSVIICARNEAENLRNYLPAVLEQDYEKYEVIVVNDCSDDDTDDVLGNFKARYTHLKITEIRQDRKFIHGKKLAVIIGIKAASYEHLLFTDADCRPESNQWVRRMASNFTGNTSIVLGYGGYFNGRGILNNYIRYDTLFIALQYFSFALCRNPYMGVGRNLAYTKSLFYSGKGFSNHLHLASGDDDLFVNEHATRENTAIEFSKESHTRSAPKQTVDKWLFQKKRHLSTGALYRTGHKWMLTLEPVSRFLFYSAMIGLFFIPGIWLWIISVFLTRMIIQLVVIKKTMIRLNEKNLLINSLFFDMISLFINFALYIVNRFRPSKHKWK